ncbi:hypothetical protein G5S37_11275 [Roseimicrobium sp. ORNL1]|nr:hypothetical protein G5S37_11275 [Roseimicrobium sp. ORNL1]
MNVTDDDALEKRTLAHTLGWILAVPVVYLLTVAPLHQAVYRWGPGVPNWLMAYETPYWWVVHNTPLGLLLRPYGEWWASVFGLPIVT